MKSEYEVMMLEVVGSVVVNVELVWVEGFVISFVFVSVVVDVDFSDEMELLVA